MSFFRKPNNKVAPAPQASAKPKLNNYLSDSETFYMCTPGKADFFVDQLLVTQAIQITTEHQKAIENEKGIIRLKKELLACQAELTKHQEDPQKLEKITNRIYDLSESLKELEIEQAYLSEQGHSYIPVEAYHSTAAEAIAACLAKDPKHDLILIEINTPVEKLNMSVVGGQEVTRPNLLSCVESVISIPQQDAKKIHATHLSNPPQHKIGSAKVNRVTVELVNKVLANATEYKKSIITQPEPSQSERKRSSASRSRKTASTLNGRVDILPMILEKNYFKTIKINPQISVVFEEIKHGKNAPQLQEPAETPRSSIRRSR